MKSFLATTTLIAMLALGACGGTATVYRDGNATGGDGVGGNISPTVSPTITLPQ